jgi:PST family polysaccharide transporter
VVFDLFAGFLYARGRSAPVLWIQIVSLVALATAMIFATHAYGIVGAGWAHVAVAVGIVLPAYLIVLRGYGVRVVEILRLAWWPTVVTLPVLAVAVIANLTFNKALPALLAGGAGAVVVYAVLMWPWLRPRLAEIRSSNAESEVQQ